MQQAIELKFLRRLPGKKFHIYILSLWVSWESALGFVAWELISSRRRSTFANTRNNLITAPTTRGYICRSSGFSIVLRVCLQMRFSAPPTPKSRLCCRGRVSNGHHSCGLISVHTCARDFYSSSRQLVPGLQQRRQVLIAARASQMPLCSSLCCSCVWLLCFLPATRTFSTFPIETSVIREWNYKQQLVLRGAVKIQLTPILWRLLLFLYLI